MLARRHAFPAASTPLVAERTTVLRMAERIGDWRALSANAIEPNPFYEPDYLLASARDIEQEDIACVAIYRDSARDADLLGLFPIGRARLTEGAFIPAFELYRNPFICSTAPLIRGAEPALVWRAFFDALRRETGQPRTVLSRWTPAARPAGLAMAEALQAEGLASTVVQSHERAAVESGLAHDAYFQGISSGRRKDLRRRQRRLAEMGKVKFHTAREGKELAAAVEAFLQLEASGWKGKAGGAMASRPETARMARQVFNAPNAEVDVLSLNGEPVAVSCNLVSGGVKHTVKIAHDERFASLSPGALLDSSILESYFKSGCYRRMDSCAGEGSRVGDQWLEREKIEWRAFSVDARTPQSRIENTAAALRGVERLKGWLKEHVGGKARQPSA